MSCSRSRLHLLYLCSLLLLLLLLLLVLLVVVVSELLIPRMLDLQLPCSRS